ncbi:hypothetical protein CPB86DRAFT_312564 [Serendipita vermifera]|nr:hypothetical protein CPB86DRAFT_312564 [Serendipita vermifera]
MPPLTIHESLMLALFEFWASRTSALRSLEVQSNGLISTIWNFFASEYQDDKRLGSAETPHCVIDQANFRTRRDLFSYSYLHLFWFLLGLMGLTLVPGWFNE